MPIHLLGQGGSGSVPFNRTFFNVTLGDLLSKVGPEGTKRLKIYLTDGLVMDVCKIDEMKDPYMTVHGFRSDDESCEITTHVIPYGLIYRLEIGPESDEEDRMGFHWSPSEEESP